MEPRIDINLGIAVKDEHIVGVRGNARDPASQQPRFKSSPVNIRKLTLGAPEPWLLERYAELSGQSIEPYAARSVGGTVMHQPAPAAAQPAQPASEPHA